MAPEVEGIDYLENSQLSQSIFAFRTSVVASQILEAEAAHLDVAVQPCSVLLTGVKKGCFGFSALESIISLLILHFN